MNHMANSQSFDGIRMSVKIPWDLFVYVEETSGDNSKEHFVREWIVNWASLAGLAPSLYRRLAYSAQKRRLPIAKIVVDALTTYALTLPEAPKDAELRLPIDVAERTMAEDAAEAEKARRKKGSSK